MALYKTLGCDPNATIDQLRRAYHVAARKKHPDKGGSSWAFSDISAAWKVLRCAETRRIYDASLLQTSVPVHADLQRGQLALDADTGLLTSVCRCGGLFALMQCDLSYDEPVLVPCDTCSLHVRVWAIP